MNGRRLSPEKRGNGQDMMHARSWLLWFLILISVGLCGSAVAADYVISRNDVLDISVYDHPEMTTTVRVDGQGMVAVPLINRVKVQGMTVSAASTAIARLLADGYIVNPQVNIFIKNFRDQKASILGQVVKPGVYDLTSKTTLLELISQAGGLTPEAGDRATIKREGSTGEEKVVQLRRLVDNGDVSQNLSIMDGDKIFIDKAGLFYVTGQVKKPDSYKYQDKLTVMKAVALAGGFTDIASKGSIDIVRKVDGKEKVVSDVDLDYLVQPEDVVVVPESFF
jgi:polysaccharide export outer membrane protein